jgi:2-methylcitrate dehydratase PrpD
VAAELVPLAIALCEQRGMSGKELVTIIAAGYDVFGAIQPGVKDVQRERGLDHKSQAGTLASAVVAALAMGLDTDKIANALALSMDMASGTEQYVFDAGLCDTKELLTGYAVRNGMYAAQLAEAGFQGPPGALDGEYGYYHALGMVMTQIFWRV